MNDDLLNRVLVPLDGSRTAEAILSQLRPFLHRHESSLILFQALTSPDDAHSDEAEGYLRRTACQLTHEGYPAKTALRFGTAAEAILKGAQEQQATMIALATRGRSGIDRLLLGSVAEMVLRGSPLPVFLARSACSPHPGRAPQLRTGHQILLPLDGSLGALGALAPILMLSHRTDARVRLLQVAAVTPFPPRWDRPDETMKAADEFLRGACIPTSLDFRKGDPAEEILRAASEQDVDLIAMTTHGRSGPPLWVMGSVATEVLRRATVPLLVVRRSSAEVSPRRNYARQTEIPATPADRG